MVTNVPRKKMKRIKYIILVLSILVAYSCDKAESYAPLQEQEEIHFNSFYHGAQTRGSIVSDFHSDDDIAVSASFLDNTDVWNKDNDKPNFMYEQAVIRDDIGNWTYNPIKYWSNDTEDHYRFFGRYPHTHTAITNKSANTTAGYPYFDFTVPEDVAEHVDLMVAQTAVMPKSTEVPLEFYHTLSRISFSVKGDDASRIVKKIVLKDIANKGKFSFTDGDFDWSIDDTQKDNFTVSTIYGLRNDIITSEFPNNITSDNGYLFMLPQDVAGKVFEVSVGPKNSSSEEETFNLTLPNPQQWKKGKTYNYILILNRGIVDISLEEDEWIPVEEDEEIKDRDEPYYFNLTDETKNFFNSEDIDIPRYMTINFETDLQSKDISLLDVDDSKYSAVIDYDNKRITLTEKYARSMFEDEFIIKARALRIKIKVAFYREGYTFFMLDEWSDIHEDEHIYGVVFELLNEQRDFTLEQVASAEGCRKLELPFATDINPKEIELTLDDDTSGEASIDYNNNIIIYREETINTIHTNILHIKARNISIAIKINFN